MKLRIATWNINSVRIRLESIARFITEQQPDILCLQETKVMDSLFPLSALQALGFEHIIFRGQPGYNGMAILAKFPLEETARLSFCERPDCRHLSANVAGIELHNVYIPAGGDVPDRTVNPAFGHKLDYVAELGAWMQKERAHASRMVLVGDLNIAPYEHDVWSHKQLLKVVSHTPVEVEALERLRASGMWCDVARHFVPMEEKLYSWWSYRNRDWKLSNRGRRLDHIWVTQDLVPALQSFEIFKDPRDWTSPSDHAPCILYIK